jgi:prepilin peptidase CpaA
MDYVLLLAFPALMAFAASSDLITMTISNRISLLLVAGFIALAFAVGMPLNVVAQHLGIGLLVLVVTFGFFVAGWIGGGDAKLAASTAIWCGVSTIMDYVIVATSLGGLLAFFLIYTRAYPLPGRLMQIDWIARLHHEKTGVPYGIALAAAGLIVYPYTQIWHLAALA